MSEIRVFEHEFFGKVRITDQEGNPWFIATDVAKALGYNKPNDAVRRWCKNIQKISVQGAQKLDHFNIIKMPDVYRLVMRSSLPKAEEFQDWIVNEVLPAIEKEGMYILPEKAKDFFTPDNIIAIATKWKESEQKCLCLEAKIEEDKPKVEFAEAVAVAKTVILVGELAKLIKQSTGYNTGQRRLFAWLRENGFVHKIGSQKNLPTQKAIDAGVLAIKEGIRTNNKGYVYVTRTTVVTGLGQTFFINKFKQLAQEQLPQCNLLQGRAA